MKITLTLTADSSIGDYADYLDDRRAVLRALNADNCYALIDEIINKVCNKHAMDTYKDAYELRQAIFEALHESNTHMEELYV